MSFAVLSKWNQFEHGCLENEPSRYMSTKYLVLDSLENNDKKNFSELIKSNTMYSYANVCSGLYPVKNTYVFEDRVFGNINYSFLNFIKKLKDKYSKIIIIKNDSWSYKFREIRGRFPTYNEYVKNKFS